MRMSVPPMAKEETITPMTRPICCQKGVAPTRKPVFKILRSGASNGRGDADDSADSEREDAVGVGGPAEEKKDGAGGHQRGDGHAADGVGGVADESADARGHGDEKKSKDHDKKRGHEIGEGSRFARRGWA